MATVNKMVVLPDESAPEIPCVPAGSGKTGLLLSRDLIFTTKIKGTAAELGYSMMVAGSESQAQSMIEAHRPRVILGRPQCWYSCRARCPDRLPEHCWFQCLVRCFRLAC